MQIFCFYSDSYTIHTNLKVHPFLPPPSPSPLTHHHQKNIQNTSVDLGGFSVVPKTRPFLAIDVGVVLGVVKMLTMIPLGKFAPATATPTLQSGPLTRTIVHSRIEEYVC